jgi:hypothetical protein
VALRLSGAKIEGRTNMEKKTVALRWKIRKDRTIVQAMAASDRGSRYPHKTVIVHLDEDGQDGKGREVAQDVVDELLA